MPVSWRDRDFNFIVICIPARTSDASRYAHVGDEELYKNQEPVQNEQAQPDPSLNSQFTNIKCTIWL